MGKSTGQIIGTVVGTVVGYFVGYPMLGAAVGGMIGGAIDPPKGPDIRGPRLSDLNVQTSSYGVVIPRVYGTVALTGNVFWIENNKLAEHEKTEEQGGKGGGGGATATSYWYSATFALGLCEGPIVGVRRIWVSGKLIYDVGSSDLGAQIYSMGALYEAAYAGIFNGLFGESKDTGPQQGGKSFTLYTGSETQTANARMEATLGVGNVPAYRGLAYLVFEDFDLTDYGNSLMGAQIKVEVLTASDTNPDSQIVARSIAPASSPNGSAYGSVRLAGDRIRETSIVFNADNFDIYSVYSQYHVITTDSFQFSSSVSLPLYHDEYLFGKGFTKVIQSDVDVVLFALSQNPTVHVIGYSPSGEKIMDSGPHAPAELPYEGVGRAVIDRGEVFFVSSSSTKVAKMPFSVYGSMPDSGLGLACPVTLSAAVHDVEEASASENFLFCVDRVASNGTGSTVVLKFDRTDLSLVDTFTYAVSGSYAKIFAVSDDWFYTLHTSGDIYTWIQGAATPTGQNYSGHGVLFTDSYLLGGAGSVFFVARPVSGSLQQLDIFALTSQITSVPAILGDIVEAECLKVGLIQSSDIDRTALVQEVRGYRVTQVAAVRTGIEVLQGAWPFDVTQSGYKIKFIMRGGASVGTVQSDDLGASSDNKNKPISITESREQDSQLARKAVISYLDVSREYDVSEQSAERLNTDAVNIRSIEMPIVLTADEAAQMVERLLYLWWLERRDLTFSLPPTWLAIEPADVVQVISDTATFEARVTQAQYLPDGVIEVSAKYNDGPVYVSTAVGAEPPYTGQVLSFAGATSAYLLDVPALLDSMDTPGFIAAVYGETAGWPGGTLMQSGDQGSTWQVAQGFAGVTPSPVGVMVSDSGPVRFDSINSRKVSLWLTCGSLISVNEIQLLAGANHFAYGAHGRWEIIAAKTCVDNGDGTWYLTDIISGRFGTEWAASLHASNDAVILLDQTLARFVGQSSNSIGLPRLYRAITKGATLDSANNIEFTYSGKNLECLSPVYVSGGRNTSNDWAISWVRRTRIGGEWADRIDVPLNEASESYVVEVYGEAGYTTLKRTISATSATVTYTSAQQTTDFGAAQSTLYVKVYQVSAAVGYGFPATVTLAASSATALPPFIQTLLADQHWASVVLAMHMDGSDGGTTFTDVKGHTITRFNVVTSTTAYKYGTASAYFPGNVNHYLTTPAVSDFLFGSGDFTVDFWIRVNASSQGKVVGIWSDTSGTGFSWKVRVGNDRIEFVYSTTGANSFYLTTTGLSIGTTAWNYIEVARSGTSLYFFLNGVKVATHSIGSASFYAVASSKLLEIGRDSAGPGDYITANLDDLRVTKGVCRHTTDYTPPFSTFPETT